VFRFTAASSLQSGNSNNFDSNSGQNLMQVLQNIDSGSDQARTDDNHRHRFSRLTSNANHPNENRFRFHGLSAEKNEIEMEDLRDPSAITLKSPQFSLSVQFSPTPETGGSTTSDRVSIR
jgi:hypothetical protein